LECPRLTRKNKFLLYLQKKGFRKGLCLLREGFRKGNRRCPFVEKYLLKMDNTPL